jgi:enamine deaminase RidA (YjgF/YER057c/UK114 family)
VAEELYAGVPYEYASEAGGLVFAAGACPLDENGVVVAAGDLESQTHRAVDHLLTALALHGCGSEEILKTTVYVATSNRAELVRAWSVVQERLAPARPPSTLLGVSVLGYPDQLVEIEAIAGRAG